MDFSTLLKGAKEPTTQSWQAWDGADEDGWEDVAEVPDLASAQPATPVAKPVEASPPSSIALDPVRPAALPTSSSTSDIQSDLQSPISKSTSQNNVHSSLPTDNVASLSVQLRAAIDRASAAERKVIALTRVREQRTNDSSQHDARLNAMREEGEKLSVRIAEKEAAVRNFKALLKERDSELLESNSSVSAVNAKLEAAASRIRQLETAERAAIDAREAAERRLREVEADARGKASSSAALDAARAQLESLRKSHTSALENQAMRLSADKESAVQDVEKKAATREQDLNKSIAELREHLSQVVDNAGWREDQLRRDNEELRLRAEQLEGRNEELAAALPNATRPLIRQVEALQAAAQERERAKQAVDRSHIERLRVAEASAVSARERERAAEERVSEVLKRCAVLEEQVRLAQSEVSRSNAEVARVQSEAASRESKWRRDAEDARSRADLILKERDDSLSEVRDARAAHMDALEAADEREKGLRSQLATAETKLAMMVEREASSKRINSSTDGTTTSAIRAAERAVTSMGVRHDSAEDVAEEGRLVEEDGTSIAGVYATERLSSSLRLRSGEVVSLQAQLDSKEKATRALAEEVVSLTAKLDEMASRHEAVPEVSKKLDELHRRHTTLLELLGEREERIGELEADLGDVKVMYKEQVTELLLRIERLNS